MQSDRLVTGRGRLIGFAFVGTGLPPRLAMLRRLAALSGPIFLTLLQAYTGGIASGYVILLMMPMIWYGLQAGDREIARSRR